MSSLWWLSLALRNRRRAWLGILAVGTAASACLAGGPPIDPITGDGGAGLGQGGETSTAGHSVEPPPTEAHVVVGATPSHGPFSGGGRVVVTGNGFGSDVRVWFGDVEVTDVVPIDATRVQVTAPPGTHGPVDLTAQNGDDESTKRTLPGGYTYDALYADPSDGPIAGGTEVTIRGQGTAWDDGTEAFIDEKACTSLDVVSATEMVCTAPKGTPGSKVVRVTSGSETISVLDAYTYEDSADGYKGGLSGDPLDGTLRALVYDNLTGDPIPDAYVVIGTDVSTGIVQQTDDTGVAVIVDDSLTGPVTVSIGGVCHSPISFVDEPVDTVTVYLDPVLVPLCGMGGDPPGVGGQVGETGIVQGEIVFPTIEEFKRGPFLVPQPLGNEKVVAYLFASGTNPLAPFTLPPETSAITPDADGDLGYGFAASSLPGNRTYYALAGLEDRTKTPATFVAYSMGVVRGVPVVNGETTDEVYLQMVPLDLALAIDASPPPPGSNGPDRLLTTAAIRLGADGFAILPSGQKAPLLPLQGDVNFVGLPLLAQGFEGATYFVSSRAVTGPSFMTPQSVVSSLQTTTTAFPVVVDGFVGVPLPVTPQLNATWDGQHLETGFGPGAPVDLTVYDVSGGFGLVHWRVAVPGGARAITLPDLREFAGVGLPPGGIDVSVIGARIDGFEYAKVRSKNLTPQGMNAYSQDFVHAHLPW